MHKKFEKTVVIDRCEYHLEFGFPALVVIEREMNRPIYKIVSTLGFYEISVIFWGLFQAHHPDLSIRETNGLVDHLGYQDTLEIVAEAIRCYFPSAVVTKGDEPATAKKAKARQPA